MRLKGRRAKQRVVELRRAVELSGGVGLGGPSASVTLNKTTRRLLADFVVWLSDRGVLIEAYEYELPGAVARSIDQIRDRLRELDSALPRGDPEHDNVGVLREATRRFANRHNRNLGWDDFQSQLGDLEWRALGELRGQFTEVLLDWYDNKGVVEAQTVLVRIPLDHHRPGVVPPRIESA